MHCILAEMRILSLSLFLSLCLAAPASAQLGQILIVDGNQPPTLPYTHTRITDAAAAAGPNDTIRVKALTWMGFSGAYSQASTLENFPIILPAGVSITAYNSQPVYVSSGIGGVTLFQVQASTGTAPLTELEDLRLLGADQAIELLTGDGQSLNVRLENVLFGRNRIGLNATASGGSLTIAAVQCQIFDHGASVPIPAPAQQDFQVGLRFAAGRADTSGIVTATVSSLTTSGPFQKMDPDPIYSFGDLYGAGGMSKLVSVELINGVPEHPGHNSGDFFTRQQIPSFQLTVNGGIWDGKAAANDKGWDVGLFAATPISTGIGWKDYFTAFDVSLNGPELRGFRESGIYAMALTESRGVVRMSGGARVKGSGKHIATNPSDLRHSGVTLLSREAYLAFIAEDARSNLILAMEYLRTLPNAWRYLCPTRRDYFLVWMVATYT